MSYKYHPNWAASELTTKDQEIQVLWCWSGRTTESLNDLKLLFLWDFANSGDITLGLYQGRWSSLYRGIGCLAFMDPEINSYISSDEITSFLHIFGNYYYSFDISFFIFQWYFLIITIADDSQSFIFL